MQSNKEKVRKQSQIIPRYKFNSGCESTRNRHKHMESYPVLRDTKNMVTMSILPKSIFKYKETWSNFNGIFHRNRTNILNICVETPRPLNSQSHSEKREQAEGISLPDFTLCDVANSPKKCGIGPKTGTHSTETESRDQK